jgi:putative acetyltransferase
MSEITVSEIALRTAIESDAAALCAAEREIARTPGRLVSAPDEFVEENFVRLLRQLDGTGTYLVAERDGKIVGHACLPPAAPLRALAHVRFLNMVVHEGYAGQGIGRRLLLGLLDAARRNGVERIELRVRATNTAAINLYRKCGFNEECTSVRRIKLADGSYLDDMSMVWFAPEKAP